jgi:rhodanese-related sulfurtransferase
MKRIDSSHDLFSLSINLNRLSFVALSVNHTDRLLKIKLKNRKMKKQLAHYESKLAYEMDPSDLFDAINKGEKVLPLDARKAFGFEAERIPTAINIPHREMTADNTKHLDKEILYVTYCDGIGCNASTRGAINMTKLDFKVKELMGGIEWWKFDGYATEGTKAAKGLQIECAC